MSITTFFSAAMWEGVVPQHPPRMRADGVAARSSASAHRRGGMILPGRPAEGARNPVAEGMGRGAGRVKQLSPGMVAGSEENIAYRSLTASPESMVPAALTAAETISGRSRQLLRMISWMTRA